MSWGILRILRRGACLSLCAWRGKVLPAWLWRTRWVLRTSATLRRGALACLPPLLWRGGQRTFPGVNRKARCHVGCRSPVVNRLLGMMRTWLARLPRLLPGSSWPAKLLPRVGEEGTKSRVAPNLHIQLICIRWHNWMGYLGDCTPMLGHPHLRPLGRGSISPWGGGGRTPTCLRIIIEYIKNSFGFEDINLFVLVK